jgi:hypothetical protein
MEKKITSPALKGLIISLILLVISIVFLIFKLEGNKMLGLIPIGIFLIGIILSNINYSNQKNANVTFANLFSHGFKASALVAGIMGLWVALSLGLLFPEALERGMEAQSQAMSEKGMSESDIDNAMELGKKVAIPMGTIFSAIIYLAIGAIGSLIGAAIAKKNPNPTPFESDNLS